MFIFAKCRHRALGVHIRIIENNEKQGGAGAGLGVEKRLHDKTKWRWLTKKQKLRCVYHGWGQPAPVNLKGREENKILLTVNSAKIYTVFKFTRYLAGFGRRYL